MMTGKQNIFFEFESLCQFFAFTDVEEEANWWPQLPKADQCILLRLRNPHGEKDLIAPLRVDTVFHRDFIFYGVDPSVRKKMMDEMRPQAVDEANADEGTQKGGGEEQAIKISKI
jgi:hypothetical protein